MLGLLAALLTSWLLLWILYRKGLLVLGIVPNSNRLSDFLFGFIIAAACCTLYYLSFSFFTGNAWMRNEKFTWQIFAASSWWTLNSVLFEELIFRGTLLYIAIQKLGIKTACIISAIAFGVYHWFSYNAFGNVMQMMFIFFMTAIWGFMFAMAFAKTQSLYLPVALHFGWNLIHIVVFSRGPLGEQLFIFSGAQKAEGILSLMLFLFQVFSVPLITYWYVKRISHRSS